MTSRYVMFENFGANYFVVFVLGWAKVTLENKSLKHSIEALKEKLVNFDAQCDPMFFYKNYHITFLPDHKNNVENFSPPYENA